MTYSREDRQRTGRIGGYTRAAMYDSKVVTEPARRAFNAKFDDQVDPDRILPEAERAKRAEAARKAYFARLAHKSAASRKKAREASQAAAEAEAELRALGGDAA